MTLVLDARIFAEYREVLSRPELGFAHERVADLLDFLWSSSKRVFSPPLKLVMPEPADAMFIEVAIAAGASAIVTGNLRHFPSRVRHGVAVLSPRQWIEAWIAESKG
ncbi:MAG: PIN domain-containing protein [Candidatus Binatia bacterium]